MTQDDLQAALRTLAQLRPVFHSEKDLQHELAWTLRERGAADIRLEWPSYVVSDEPMHLDLLLKWAGQKVGIELKYWKRGLDITLAGERFHLKNQAAQDISRYDLWWDVSRLERLRDLGIISHGFALALSSDHAYWNKGREGTVDQDFRLHEGREATGTLAWKAHAGKGTMHKREEPIVLQGQYTLRWTPYARLSPDYELRALIVPVGAPGASAPVFAQEEPERRPRFDPRWDRRRGRRWR